MFLIEEILDDDFIEKAFDKAVSKIKRNVDKANVVKRNNKYSVDFEEEGKALSSGVFDYSAVVSNEPFDYNVAGSSSEKDFISTFTKELES